MPSPGGRSPGWPGRTCKWLSGGGGRGAASRRPPSGLPCGGPGAELIEVGHVPSRAAPGPPHGRATPVDGMPHSARRGDETGAAHAPAPSPALARQQRSSRSVASRHHPLTPPGTFSTLRTAREVTANQPLNRDGEVRHPVGLPVCYHTTTRGQSCTTLTGGRVKGCPRAAARLGVARPTG